MVYLMNSFFVLFRVKKGTKSQSNRRITGFFLTLTLRIVFIKPAFLFFQLFSFEQLSNSSELKKLSIFPLQIFSRFSIDSFPEYLSFSFAALEFFKIARIFSSNSFSNALLLNSWPKSDELMFSERNVARRFRLLLSHLLVPIRCQNASFKVFANRNVYLSVLREAFWSWSLNY